MMSGEEVADFQHVLRVLCEEEYGWGEASNVNRTSPGPCDNLTAFASTINGDYYEYTDNTVDVLPENIIVPIIFGSTLISGKLFIYFIINVIHFCSL